jgi:hypothetical protein
MLSRRTLQEIASVVLSLWLAVAPALAGQMTLLGVGSAGSAAPPPVLAYVGNASGTASHTGAVETYTNASIGSTAGFTTRRIIFVLTTNSMNPSSIASFTVNGGAPVNGAIHVQQQNGASGPFAAIFSADIATGTTATIAVTYNTSVFNDQNLAVYSVDDALLVSTTPNTGAGTASAATSSATSSFTQTTGGFTVAGEGMSTSVTTLAITGYTTNQNGGSSNVITSSLTSIASTGSVTAASTWATSASAAIVAASWR